MQQLEKFNITGLKEQLVNIVRNIPLSMAELCKEIGISKPVVYKLLHDPSPIKNHRAASIRKIKDFIKKMKDQYGDDISK